MLPPEPMTCELNSVPGARCASMEDAYNASRGGASGGPVQSVFDPRYHQQGQVPPGYSLQNQLSAYPEPGNAGMPVFQQPRVMRVWVAPYVDSDGNLRSGEYTYFSTPGQWNYGSLKKPGEASGAFAPARPDQLGIPRGTAPRNAPMAPSSSAPQAPASSGSITQPYQTLSK